MIKKLIMSLLFVLVNSTAFAAEFEVGQRDKQFSKKTLTIKTGDSVKFTNNDPFFHNVFSLSDLKTFDLGSYPTGQSKSVTFDKAGTYDIECAIHPNMKLKLKVE